MMAIEPTTAPPRRSYFTIAEPDSTLHTYSHPLVDWGAVIAGTLVAIAIGFALNILGVAIGATAINPWQGTSEQAPAWTIGGGLYVMFANLVALQIGAFVAVRAARWPDHHSGMLQGLVVWALAFAVAGIALGLGVGAVLSGDANAQQAASAAVNAAQAATGEATNASPTLTPAETDAVQDATALTAWWAFATLVFGAIGAVAGGKLGSAHPDWHARGRHDRAVTMADKI
jgi:hypothetical protein